ncbi:hypothetical protein F511_39611 [Dorcoceras hygrometricum]|uniref:Uncharacterized protein n=1 Tax=Dorcoceras hygrometricum TaxID=472368 RepID=A0A2Z7A8M4_9LAMI|nr:hypothetical protein F511_39611 [Dorcoceras hygrometricum]
MNSVILSDVNSATYRDFQLNRFARDLMYRLVDFFPSLKNLPSLLPKSQERSNLMYISELIWKRSSDIFCEQITSTLNCDLALQALI